MKKVVASGLVAFGILSAVAGPSVARQQKAREDVQQYSPPPRALGADTDMPGVLVGRATFDPGTARAVSLTIEDSGSPAVFAKVRQGQEVMGKFCSSTDAPIAIHPGVPVEVELFVAPCGDGVGAPTTGVVRAVFTRGGRV